MKAAIDIGSNSIRLLIEGGKTRSVITKLADGLDANGTLSANGVERTVDALMSFAEECRKNGVDDLFAFATEAVRKARDGEIFCKTVKERTGIDITVLSPEAEAELALAGTDKPHGEVTVCDLGGGSLEVISSPNGTTPDYIKSLPLGVVVLKNRYDGDYRKAINEMPSHVQQYSPAHGRPVVLSGGSACALAAGMLGLKIYDKKAVTTKFRTEQLDDFMPIVLSRDLALFRPVCAKRADTLPYGAIVLQALLNRLGATEFYVSDAGNLEAAIKR